MDDLKQRKRKGERERRKKKECRENLVIMRCVYMYMSTDGMQSTDHIWYVCRFNLLQVGVIEVGFGEVKPKCGQSYVLQSTMAVIGKAIFHPTILYLSISSLPHPHAVSPVCSRCPRCVLQWVWNVFDQIRTY